MHSKYADDFAFSVPEGVDFISADDKVHFSSVLAYHHSSKTIHVDDTYMYARLPLPLRLVGVQDVTRFHPTLAKALQPRAGASQEFRKWAKALSAAWDPAENLCTAHLATLAAGKNNGLPVSERLFNALSEVENTLANHEQEYG